MNSYRLVLPFITIMCPITLTSSTCFDRGRRHTQTAMVYSLDYVYACKRGCHWMSCVKFTSWEWFVTLQVFYVLGKVIPIPNKSACTMPHGLTV